MKKEAMLFRRVDDGAVDCGLCAHRCHIPESGYGKCGVRVNQKGTLYTLVYGESVANHADPVEKKPLYHFLPGTRTFSFSTIGCNFRCGFCQNWQISQESKKDTDIEGFELTPEVIIREAVRHGCQSISYTYTEPTIFFEYAYDTARLAKEKGLKNIFVTNGYMTKEAFLEIRPFLDAANIDLKGFSDGFYKKNCGARLAPVLDTIKLMKDSGVWVEVTTLLIPGENDSDTELSGIARFLAETGAEIPWHISRFHPDYDFVDREVTPLDSMQKAVSIGREQGLKYVYMGNVLESSSTFCPECNAELIRRWHFKEDFNNLDNGKCPSCGEKIAGIWEVA